MQITIKGHAIRQEIINAGTCLLCHGQNLRCIIDASTGNERVCGVFLRCVTIGQGRRNAALRPGRRRASAYGGRRKNGDCPGGQFQGAKKPGQPATNNENWMGH